MKGEQGGTWRENVKGTCGEQGGTQWGHREDVVMAGAQGEHEGTWRGGDRKMQVGQEGDTEVALPQLRCCPHPGLDRHLPPQLGSVTLGKFFSTGK